MKFTDEHKTVKEFSDANWFDFGVHKVKIAQIELGETDGGKEYLEFTVIGGNEEEDTARVWFTTDKAINYSINVVRQIYVHNAPEDKKDAAKETFDSVADLEALHKLLNEKLVGGECWFTKYQSPDRTYTAQDGSVRKSVDKNIMGYEPKPRTDLLAKVDDVVDLNSDDAALNIPKNW